MSLINEFQEKMPGEVLVKFKDMLYKEAEETKKQALSTIKLSIEVYKDGEKELALVVLKESMRIAKSYLELMDKLDADKDTAISIITAIEEIEELMNQNEKVSYIYDIYNEL
ncbi:hypothetical protein [Fervidicoccus fontis]|nr:hypothetical protein [Fervidicoccus fontis]PMB75976.1 MAG: hypothetical protein C0188_00870 [Fervidicoccus fontis]PMB77863.1 MAG: hypothetical protein C0177_01955 [Fervidicoccus fontis]HEW63575.1 hypothetical protein [Fervidicoccus fontis]